MTIILVFGDSITQGFWDIEGGWVQRLRKYLDEKQLKNTKYYFSVFNMGVSGDTSKDVLERFDFETKQRLKLRDEGEEVIIIFSVGGNDSMLNNKTKKNSISINDFRENLRKLFSIAKKYSKNVTFVGDMPIDESKVDPIPWLNECSYKNKYLKEYQEIAEIACKKEEVLFIDIYQKFIDKKYQNLLQDGCHPNSEGHKLIYEVVKDELERLKII